MTREEAASISRAAIYNKLSKIIDPINCKIVEESYLGKFNVTVEIRYTDEEFGYISVRDLIEKFYSSQGFDCSVRYIRYVEGFSAINVSVSW